MHCTSLFSSLLFFCGSVIASPAVSHQHYSQHAGRSAWDGSMRANAYYGNWDIYARSFFVTEIPASQLSHITYAFANVNATTGEVYLSDTWADLEYAYAGDDTSANGTNVYGNVKQLYLLKKKYRSLKTVLSIGGYTYSPNFSPVIASAALRANFVSSATKLMTDLGFDGLDIDYEYVANATEAAYMVALLKGLRETMDEIACNFTSSPFLLSYASPAGPTHYKVLDFPGMDQYLDYWNYMGFDYAGSWDTVAGHQANLYEDFSNPSSTPFNTTSAIAYYVASGVASSKINLGSPLYARAFNNTNGPGTAFNGTGSGGSFDSPGVWDYKALPLSGFNATLYDLKKVGASYSYDAAQKYMLSYDSPAIAKQKAKWVLSTGLGGTMWWEVSMDKNGTDSLIGATVKTFGGSKKLDSSLNHLNYPTSKYDNLREGMPGQ